MKEEDSSGGAEAGVVAKGVALSVTRSEIKLRSCCVLKEHVNGSKVTSFLREESLARNGAKSGWRLLGLAVTLRRPIAFVKVWVGVEQRALAARLVRFVAFKAVFLKRDKAVKESDFRWCGILSHREWNVSWKRGESGSHCGIPLEKCLRTVGKMWRDMAAWSDGEPFGELRGKGTVAIDGEGETSVRSVVVREW